MFLVSIAVLFVGIFFLGWSGAIYKWRAFRNKKAWNGLTLPLLIIGIPVTLIGIALIYFTYPYK